MNELFHVGSQRAAVLDDCYVRYRTVSIICTML
jgi:hypothetical protein